jgi:hypothetical protein
VLKRLVAMPLLFALATGMAWAYWSAGSGPGGNGASAATSVNQGATPTASSTGSSVTVSWAASTLSNGNAVTGYSVKRYDVGTLTSQTMLSACTGMVAATTCVESGVPVGNWVYSVTPVFATNWIGAESLKSSSVTVAAPPVNAITLSGISGGAYKSSNTIYYRGAAAGSFTLTNAVSGGTGPASSATAALGGTTTNWTHTPSTVSTPAGGPYVSSVFSWTLGATSSPTEVVTGRDTGTGATGTTLSFVNDSTAPGAGTITYTDGYQIGRAVPLTFTTGTDGGSGLNTRQLQRQSATLTGGTCGSYGSFANQGTVNPTSPYTDSTVTGGFCYKYRYVVTDLVGNAHTATSASVAKIDYANAVNATTGLLSQWRLGESGSTGALAVNDTFTGTAGAALDGRTGETGATWTATSSSWSDPWKDITAVITNANRIRKNESSSQWALYYSSGVPASANYRVKADLYVASLLTGSVNGVLGRLSTSSPASYAAVYDLPNARWALYKVDSSGGSTLIGTPSGQTLTAGATYNLALDMNGTTIRLLVDGVQRISVVDSTITSVGRGGVTLGFDTAGDTTVTNTAGMHLDNFNAATLSVRAADSKGSNTADYLNQPALAVAGAITGDSNTAAQFDGTNDYVQAVGTTSIPVGASVRSVEMWFKTSSAARQVLFNYGTVATNQEYGLWLNAGGASMTAWGKTNDNTFTLAAAVNDGAWHHVVKTYDGTSITLYVDGVALTPQAATRATVMNTFGFGIGAVIDPADAAAAGGYFNGSIDEVSFYTTTLSQTTVTNHYELGILYTPDVTGPTGGSVDATGLAGTGSRYAASTTLSLAFDAGTDPSGVAPTGALFQRATATLTSAGTTNGTCGTYSAFSTVSGGTDPTSPKSDTVIDQACYKYQYVVADTLGNPTTYTSGDIKVDLTAPAAPSLTFSAFTNTYWSGSGSTVFYRSGATPGSFIATASTTDTASGIASYAFPALGTNWTSTPGALGVNTYTWSGAPAAPGMKSVTATNNAAGASSGTSFTLTADDTAPSAGTVTYTDGLTGSTSVSVNFTTGTDGGSGIGTRLLQRKSATLTTGTCGSYGAFATVTNGTNPTSPLVETVARGFCYQYQYVVSDNVGLLHTATSASVVKVATYLDLIKGTTGLVSYWRLGESTGTNVSSDSFTDTAGTELKDTHTGELGATWDRPGAYNDPWSDKPIISNANRARKASGDTWGVLYSSGVPASANYSVQADVYVASTLTGDVAGVMGRLSTSTVTGYAAVYSVPLGQWALYKLASGTKTLIGTPYSQTLAAASTYRLTLDMSGTTIRLLVDGVQRISVVDTTVSVTGTGGVTLGFQGASSTSTTDTAGMQLDNYTVGTAATTAADSQGTNTGTYVNAPTLGVTGGITGDSNTAVQFDGTNDYVTVARQISDDFSIEFRFKSTQGIGTGTTWSSGAGLVDADVTGTSNDFGVSLRSDGKVVAGVGGVSDTSIVSTSGGYNNGAWHHVVFTRTKTSGALTLYVDGVSAGSGTGSTVSLTSPANINLGRIQTGTNYFAGTLDEVAVYNTVLSGATATSHYAGGQ